MADFADEAAALQQEEISASLRAHAMRRKPPMSWCTDCYGQIEPQRHAAGFHLCALCESDRKAEGGRHD